MPSTTLDFDIGKASGSCSVYFEPADYEGIYKACPEFVEFTNVSLGARVIEDNKVNKALQSVLREAWENKKQNKGELYHVK